MRNRSAINHKYAAKDLRPQIRPIIRTSHVPTWHAGRRVVIGQGRLPDGAVTPPLPIGLYPRTRRGIPVQNREGAPAGPQSASCSIARPFPWPTTSATVRPAQTARVPIQLGRPAAAPHQIPLSRRSAESRPHCERVARPHATECPAHLHPFAAQWRPGGSPPGASHRDREAAACAQLLRVYYSRPSPAA